MKSQTGVNRYARPHPPLAEAALVRRCFAPLVESPGSVYFAGVGLGIGCGGLVVVLLLGMLSL
jgi:hypothetical protein